jgi:hypothetical protein
VLTSSPDTAWNNWPSDASYVVTCLELARYAGRPLAGERQLDIGAALSLPVDPARHQLDVRVQPPAPRSAATVRAAPSGSDMLAEYRETDHAGFYEVTLTSHEQKPPEVRLFAVNPPADEGDARRLDLDDFENRLRKDDIELVRKLGAGSATAETVKQEFWRVILALLFLALCAEQVLAWLFGMRR